MAGSADNLQEAARANDVTKPAVMENGDERTTTCTTAANEEELPTHDMGAKV